MNTPVYVNYAVFTDGTARQHYTGERAAQFQMGTSGYHPDIKASVAMRASESELMIPEPLNWNV